MSATPQSIRQAQNTAGAEQLSSSEYLAHQQALSTVQTSPMGAAGYGPGHRPGAEAAAPAAQRLSGGQWAGKTGVLNNAQAGAAQGDMGPVWVTVPVDKVEVEPSGIGHASPVYATPKGYRAHPGESAGSIPPPMAAGH